jgi:hypothetical protein
MTLHLIKLCVGAESVEDLAAWISSGRANWPRGKRTKRAKYAAHITRQTPRRAEELLAGGSLYWVIRGQILVRQRLVRLDACRKNGTPHCALVMENGLVLTRPRPRRAFQGWRYLAAKDAPADIGAFISGAREGSQSLRRELMALGLD